MVSANPFGGSYFAPLITSPTQPLSFLKAGDPLAGFLTITNKDRMLAVATEVTNSLANMSKKVTKAAEEPLWQKRARLRAANCGQGNGMFAEGCRAYADSLVSSGTIASSLAASSVAFSDGEGELTKATRVALSYFKLNLTSAALVFRNNNNFDTHGDASRSPALFDELIQDLASVFELLSKTPYNVEDGTSMLDVTTVMISSEFGRTHLQSGKSVGATGTDHNPQANMVILAGKSVKGDQVIGSTDLDTLDATGNFTAVAPAHRSLDQELLKKFGRPFDFDAGHSSLNLPASYNLNDYISSASVINTVMDLLGISSSNWLGNETRPGANSGPARTIKTLHA